MKAIYKNVRASSVIERAEQVGINGYAIIEKIANFPSVETFQAWKNEMMKNDTMVAYCVNRVGGNVYRLIRDNYTVRKATR